MAMGKMGPAAPRSISTLIGHPGIGFVMVRADDDGAIILGPRGSRRLQDDSVSGEDPLRHFGENAAEHLRRTDGFPHCPDLLVNCMIRAGSKRGRAVRGVHRLPRRHRRLAEPSLRMVRRLVERGGRSDRRREGDARCAPGPGSPRPGWSSSRTPPRQRPARLGDRSSVNRASSELAERRRRVEWILSLTRDCRLKFMPIPVMRYRWSSSSLDAAAVPGGRSAVSTEELEEMGPIDYLVIAWPGRQPTGEAAPLRGRPGRSGSSASSIWRSSPRPRTVRCRLEIAASGQEVEELKVFEGASSGLLSDDDAAEAAEALDRAPRRHCSCTRTGGPLRCVERFAVRAVNSSPSVASRSRPSSPPSTLPRRSRPPPRLERGRSGSCQDC